MDVPHLSWGRKGPLSLIAAALALVALTPAPAAAEQRVSGTASASAGCGWPAGWAAGAVAFGTGYGSPSGSLRVREVQRRLKRAGARPGPVDGLFGPLTRAAVKRFQRRQRVAATGVVGRRTLALLRSRTGRGNQRTAHAPEDEPRTAAAHAGRDAAVRAGSRAGVGDVVAGDGDGARAHPRAAAARGGGVHELRGPARPARGRRWRRRRRSRDPRRRRAAPVLGYVTVSRDEAQGGGRRPRRRRSGHCASGAAGRS